MSSTASALLENSTTDVNNRLGGRGLGQPQQDADSYIVLILGNSLTREMQ